MPKEPELELEAFGCSLRLPAAFPHGCALCVPNHFRGGGGGGRVMNVTGGDTFCLCFKESDVPFVNIQEKY